MSGIDVAVVGGGAVRLHFADGRTATAGLLVGADGVNSVVRQRLLPAPLEEGSWHRSRASRPPPTT
ncbi:hypothetical protein ACFYNO_40610 [Kitasatospora sp. NPDC006697]|uniref:hypothetical protein n=1 Tax=Kitasatospora sp. NPDC006697 TaxID=3364020 RepID=UPI0036B29D80